LVGFWVASQGVFAYKGRMGYIFDADDAQNYERWLADENNRWVLERETALMTSLARPLVGESLLDIGCGTGESLKPYLGKGINLTGIDPSSSMLRIARENLGHRVDFHRGYAEDLPFHDNAFNHAVLFLTLEFVDDAEKGIEEACRVAKDSVFIGILNKHSAHVAKLRINCLFRQSVYRHARFFSIGNVRQMVFKHLGPVPFTWQTVLHYPGAPHGFCHRLELGGYLKRSPFGAFAGIKAIPVPRLQTIPMPLKVRSTQKATAGERVTSCYEEERYGGNALRKNQGSGGQMPALQPSVRHKRRAAGQVQCQGKQGRNP